MSINAWFGWASYLNFMVGFAGPIISSHMTVSGDETN